MIVRVFAAIAIVALFHGGPSWAQSGLTDDERAWLAKASRTDVNGWIWLKTGGAPFERGFQHGYLVAEDFKEAWRVYDAMTLQTTGMELSFFVEKGAELHKPKIPPEQLDEMRGIAAGLTKAGVATTLDQIIGWNGYMEMTGYWWPTVAAQYKSAAPAAYGSKAKSHCSAFIATGSATTDGRIVIGHTSFTEFWNGQFMNVILDITPEDGQRMVMQTSPGWIASMTDFWVTGGGLVVVETTLVGYEGYDTRKVPEYLMRLNPSSRTISSHYDTDPQPFVSDPNAVWNVPFYPAGSVDGKATTADAAAGMSMWGRFGRADGLAFDAEEFLRIHPQWNWQQGYLKSRPHEPWTYFDGQR